MFSRYPIFDGKPASDIWVYPEMEEASGDRHAAPQQLLTARQAADRMSLKLRCRGARLEALVLGACNFNASSLTACFQTEVLVEEY